MEERVEDGRAGRVTSLSIVARQAPPVTDVTRQPAKRAHPVFANIFRSWLCRESGSVSMGEARPGLCAEEGVVRLPSSERGHVGR